MTIETTGQQATGTETAVTDTTAAQTTTTETTASDPVTTETKAVETTLLAGDVADKQVVAPADWPSDWREKLAGEDKKALEQLKRYGAPTDLWSKTRSLEQKLSSGDLKRTLPDNATPEQIAEYRKEAGLPDKPEAYLDKLELPNGVVLGDADKPVVAAFAEAAFEGNVDPAQYSKLVAKYYEMQDKVAAQRAEADHAFKQQSEDALRAEFGPEYRANLNAVKNLLNEPDLGLAGEDAEKFLAGRMADGRRIGDSPDVIKWLSNISRELNPAATLMPAGSGDQGKGVSDRLSEIRKFRQENPDRYDMDKGLQAEELRLLEAHAKIRSRNAA